MKLKLILVALAALICALGLFSLLSSMTPRVWPITSGTLKVTKVAIAGQNFVMIDGPPMNYLGQIQSLEVVLDDSSNKLVVSRYRIRWNPFTQITVNNQWPIFYSLEFVKPGKYSVVYRTTDGEATAGTFDVP
jgi:hypothetical protein